MASKYYDGRGSFRRERRTEDTDPMSSLANMADVMLVFACGLMASLIIAWNVDLSQFAEVEVGEEQEIQEPEAMEDVLQGGGTSFVERGTVYQDAETGQFYLVEPTEEGSGSGASGSGASGSQGSSGSQGASGSQDASGSQGSADASGASGSQGSADGSATSQDGTS